LQKGGGIPEIQRFHNHYTEYKIVIYGSLNCDDIIFKGQVTSEKRVNLLYDKDNRHYHVIGNLIGAMSKQYICEACNQSCRSGVTHRCREKCTDSMSTPPCVCTDVRIPCEECNRTFRSQACFDKHKTNKLKKDKTVCEQNRNCAKCNGLLDPTRKHECFKSFCDNCQKNREYGHLCYSEQLPKSDDVLFVFYDFETTQDTRISDSATLNVPNLVCLQQFCSQCEMQADIDTDCEGCGRRRHSFWEDPVGDLLSHLCEK